MCYQHEDFTAPHRVGRSPIQNRKKIKHVWHLQVASNRSPAISNEKEQTGKQADVAFYSAYNIFTARIKVLLSPLLFYGAKRNAKQDSRQTALIILHASVYLLKSHFKTAGVWSPVLDKLSYEWLGRIISFGWKCPHVCDLLIFLKLVQSRWLPAWVEIITGNLIHSITVKFLIVFKFDDLNLSIFLCLYINSTPYFFLVPFFLGDCFLIFHVHRLFLILRGFETMLRVELEL